MARYLTLLRFTEKGAKAMSKSPSRAKAFAAAAKQAGVTVEAQYWCLGACDGVLIVSGDGNKPLQQIARLAALGNVSTQTVPLMDADEFGRLFK